ncbi:sugar ABC transporter ATP-binding protein [Pararobbsia alpina]|uniref:Arabinose import ATP-binding protein AraG n=1 Tax=Pararobbsia alpina TaxID=621374 RepID=A0A6S7BSY5_9BURK|nr:sugar ABC transporter ATP-binding protein [Pararobbsia alpina]CAB3798403.1 Arabinose import ATP-binding protein AraG [Pararobbsia alpina]
MTLLSVRNVTKRYGGVTALASVDLEIEAGHVLGLLGANGSGKSTLSGVISGETRPDEGSVLVDGQPLPRGTPRAARQAGIVIAHQHPGLAPDLPVWENVFLGAERCMSGGFIDRRAARREAADALETLRAGWDIDVPAGTLGAADQQLIEIAKALVLRPRLLILDEPTAALAAAEVDALIGMVKALAAQGTAIVFISHRMAEIEALCDSVVVLCNGKRIGQLEVGGSLDEARVLQMMGGIAGGAADTDATPPEATVHLVATSATAPGARAATSATTPGARAATAPSDFAATGSTRQAADVGASSTPAESRPLVMTVRGLKAGRRLAGADLTLRRGEVLGVAGLQGHGQDELLDALAGFLPHEAGEVVLDGETIMPRSPRQMISCGVCLVPNDRHRQGLWLDHSVEFNLAQVRVNFDRHAWQLRRTELRTMVADVIDRLRIKTSNPRQPVRALSGGNQQKVVIGRWLDRDVKVLLLSDPTKGVDVIARKQIYQAIHALAESGVAILLYASDTDELLAVCDRLLVMYEGRVVSELEGPSMNEAQVTRASFGRSAA